MAGTKNFIPLAIFSFFISVSEAQNNYDSITISRFLIKGELYGAKWPDTLKAGHFSDYISNEKNIGGTAAVSAPNVKTLLSLTQRIQKNGTADITKCFIPRHSVNYYKNGKIVRYMLVCFECDGLRFSDDGRKTFVRSVAVRESQMVELKKLFKELL